MFMVVKSTIKIRKENVHFILASRKAIAKMFLLMFLHKMQNLLDEWQQLM